MANLFPVATAFAAAVAFVSAASIAVCEETADESARRVGIVFEGTFESAEVSRLPEGARKTQLVATYEWDYGVRSFSRKLWAERGFEWDAFLTIARRVGDAIAEKIEPRLVRDHREVVEYVLVHDEDPFLTGALLSNKFYERFRETLGDRIHAVVVDRHRIYLFPATGGKLEEFGPALVEEFRRTALPVSLEIFELDGKAIGVIGEIERE
ncbi:MAG: hypothetical protein WD342_00925 [Verrucomicrobiales bacterium]